MVTLTNYSSGELVISDETGRSLRLSRDQANRLIMTARMRTTEDLIEKLPSLMTDETLVKKILGIFEGKNSSERWFLKEKFARLTTLIKGYEPENPGEILETVTF